MKNLKTYPRYELWWITNSQKNLKRAWNGIRKLDPRHSIIFHVEIQDSENSDLYYHEYQLNRFTGTTLNLRCAHDSAHLETNCSARLVIEYGSVPVKNFNEADEEKKYDFDTEDESIIRNINKWGTVKHKCSTYCDMKCTSKHDQNCYSSSVPTDIKRRYRTKIVQTREAQGSSYDFKFVRQLCDMEFGLAGKVNGKSVPAGIKRAHGIYDSKEKRAFSCV